MCGQVVDVQVTKWNDKWVWGQDKENTNRMSIIWSEWTKRSAYEQKIGWRDEKERMFGQKELLRVELEETRDERRVRRD
mgnify:CR=1 FL=1